MKNTFWSQEVQSTELLYYSREEKFNKENRNLWFKYLKIKNGMKILEVGCGGGLFTNMIKRYFPDCEVYGIDIDDNHIEFAKKKCKELNLDVKYSIADINNLPFEDEMFDLVFSHTVVEHIPFDNFIREQKRVLKTGGRILIMRVDMIKKNDKPFMYLEEEIGKQFEKLEFKEREAVAKYLEDPDITMQRLNEYNFKNIDLKFERIVYYTPDTQKNDKIAISQIERNYMTKLKNALFYLGIAKNGDKIRENLLNLLEKQYFERLRLYKSKNKLYDFQSSNMIFISAEK